MMEHSSRKPSPIDLFRGWPHPSLHPISALKKATETVLSDPSIHVPGLGYGPDDGYLPLREEIAKWLSDFYKPAQNIGPERICITGGASQNMACILQVFSDPGYTRNIWMVSPTYHLACRIFDDAGFVGKMRSVPEDEEGIDVEYLERKIRQSEEMAADNTSSPFKTPRPWRKIFKHIIYAVPTFSNPSSKVMSIRRREQVVRLARCYDALVITDDVYDHLQWSSSAISQQSQPRSALAPRLVDVDRFLDGGPKDEFGNCVSNGSFSKLVGGGCRVGWAEGTQMFAYGVSQAGSSRSGGAPSQFTSTFVWHLLSSGFLQAYIPEVITPAYSKRYHILSAAIDRYLLPLGVERTDNTSATIAGGYFFWLRLPRGMKASQVAERARDEENLMIGDGMLFAVEGEVNKAESNDDDDLGEVLSIRSDLENYIRICLAYEEEEYLGEGIKRLASVIQKQAGG
ncbi:hypothetical protein FQN57_001786 [Myotisia sp. PD_48]|nr:hypothetical protein FQN57_001786 [Myotisia sp. PD_48]